MLVNEGEGVANEVSIACWRWERTRSQREEKGVNGKKRMLRERVRVRERGEKVKKSVRERKRKSERVRESDEHRQSKRRGGLFSPQVKQGTGPVRAFP